MGQFYSGAALLAQFYTGVNKAFNIDGSSYCRKCNYPLSRFLASENLRRIAGIAPVTLQGSASPVKLAPAQNSSPSSSASTAPTIVKPQEKNGLLPPNQPLPMVNIMLLINGRITDLEGDLVVTSFDIVESEVKALRALIDFILFTRYISPSSRTEIEVYHAQLRSIQQINNKRKYQAILKQNELRMNLAKLDGYSAFLKEVVYCSAYDIPTLETSLVHLKLLLTNIERDISFVPLSVSCFQQLRTIYYRLPSIEADIKKRAAQEEASRWREVLSLLGDLITVATALIGLGGFFLGKKTG